MKESFRYIVIKKMEIVWNMVLYQENPIRIISCFLILPEWAQNSDFPGFFSRKIFKSAILLSGTPVDPEY